MSIPYDRFTGAFLAKITEYDFLEMKESDRQDMIDGYMKAAISAFRNSCLTDLTTTGDDEERVFCVDVSE